MRAQIVIAVLALFTLAPPGRAQVPPFVTSWGSYGIGNSQFNTPVGVAVDPDGVVYVVDSNLNCLKRFSRTGSYLSQWPVSGPVGVALGPDACVYIARSGMVSKFTKEGALLAQWSVGGAPAGIAVDVDGSVYVADRTGYIRKFTGSGAALSGWTLCCGGPDGVAVDGRGYVYTVENAGVVKKFTTSGQLRAQWGGAGQGDGQFDLPVRLAASADGSRVYVVDNLNSRVQVFTSDGAFLGKWGTPGTGPGQFRGPVGIALDGQGNIFVADTNNSRIQVFGDAATPARRLSWGQLKHRYH